MKRLLSVMSASLLMLGLLTTTALGAEPVAPTIAPPSGQWTIRGGQQATFGGTTDALATLVEARVVGLDAAGAATGATQNVFSSTTLTGGTIGGSAFLGSWINDVVAVALSVTVLNADGSEVTGVSDPLPVDTRAPEIVEVATVERATVRVTFSENVVSSTGDRVADWTVNAVPPVAVSGSGAERFLTLAREVGEDDRPAVRYVPAPLSQPYTDGSRNILTSANRFATALDRIPPAIPRIDSVAGKSGASVTANDATPDVKVSNVTDDHTVSLTKDGGATVLAGPVTAAAGASLVSRELADGTHVLQVIATDRNGNSTTSADVTYALDTIIPALSGVLYDGAFVTVTWSEPVIGADDPTQWSLTRGRVEAVGGTGSTRRLTVSGDTTGALLAWTPPAANPYRDEAGNHVVGFTVPVGDGLVPSLRLIAPRGGESVRGGSILDIRWEAADANFDSGPIGIDFSPNGGGSWSSIATGQANDGVFTWQVPSAATANGIVRITAVDRAGNEAIVRSNRFSVLAPHGGSVDPGTPPTGTAPATLDARTVDPRTIEVVFSRPVSGTVAADEWFVDGEPVGSIAAGEQPIDRVTLGLSGDSGTNAAPVVTYSPKQAPDRTPLAVASESRAVTAQDGIAPQTAAVATEHAVVDADSISLNGTADPGPGNEVVVNDVAAPVSDDGSFVLDLPLIPDNENVFDLVVRDPSGNVSAPVTVTVVEDSTAPSVELRRPRLRGRRLAVTWSRDEVNPARVRLGYRIAGGRRGTIARTRDDGRYVWRFPRRLRGKTIRISIVAIDAAGHRSRDTSRHIRLR